MDTSVLSISKVFSVSDLRLKPSEILDEASSAPVIITHRSRAKVVVYDYEAFVGRMARLAELERTLLISEQAE